MSTPPELESTDDEMADSYIYRRNRRIRATAWIVIGALILTGGGATVLLTLFG